MNIFAKINKPMTLSFECSHKPDVESGDYAVVFSISHHSLLKVYL